MDRVGADFDRVVDQIRNKLEANPVPIQIPLGSEDAFVGVIDLVRMKAFRYLDETLGAEFQIETIPEAFRAEAEECREKLLEAVAETSEQLLTHYLSEGSLSEEQIRAGLRSGTVDNSLVPVLCGSAFKNKGIQLVLDAVVDYLPSPMDVC